MHSMQTDKSSIKRPSNKSLSRRSDILARQHKAFDFFGLLRRFIPRNDRTREKFSPPSLLLLRPAFTLAEVLITLGIIGIVAAMTIPSLVNHYQNTQYIIQLKKFYTNFNQTLSKISSDNGCVNDLKCTGLFAAGTTNNSLGTAVVKYFKVTKNCGISPNQGCWSSSVNTYIDGQGTGTNIVDYNANVGAAYQFVTADGMSVLLHNYGDASSGFSADCANAWSNSGSGYMSKTCGIVLVDVNGLKKPNYIGRDIFSFWITSAKGVILYPNGAEDDKQGGAGSYWWDGTTKRCVTNNGWQCTGRVVEEGWEMNY